jgi:hypothetical protein
MPMNYGAAPAPRAQPKQPPAPQLSPERIAELEAMGLIDDAGNPIAPMGDNPFAGQGASQTGGPSGEPGDIRSGIFKDIYRRGRQSGNGQLMDMMRPPVPEDDPFAGMQLGPIEEPEEDFSGPMANVPPLPPSPGAPDPSMYPPHLQAMMPREPSGRERMAQQFPGPMSRLGGAQAMGRRGRY